MAVLLAPPDHAARWGAVRTSTYQATQLIAFTVLFPWLMIMGTKGERHFGCHGDKCENVDVFQSPQSTRIVQMVHAELSPTLGLDVRRPQRVFERRCFDIGKAMHVDRLQSRRTKFSRITGLQRRKIQFLDGSRQIDNATVSKEEVEALISFKRTISTDPLKALSKWNVEHSPACKWTGVICSLSSNRHVPSAESHVISVNLTGLQLRGNTDLALRALGRLRFLNKLDLSNNSFTGSMSGLSFVNWTSMSTLNMSGNSITGALPPEVGQLLNIQVLDFHVNNLTGGIPVSIFNCTALKTLDLGINFFRGPIPEQVGKLSLLKLLKLGNDVTPFQSYHPEIFGNSFMGTVPALLANCTSLEVLELQANPDLGGEILQILIQLRSLRIVRISYCSFLGSVPVGIGNLTRVHYLSLGSNQFHGHIPAEIGSLLNLRSLYLDMNNFSGVLPSSITNCTEMLSLSFQDNELMIGKIPSEIGRLSKLLFITVWSNSLTGVIPASLSNCSELEILEISDMPTMSAQPMPLWLSSMTNLGWVFLNSINLYGTIPREIGDLSNLEILSIYSNNLTGRIPPELGNCSLLTVAQLQDNQFNGPLPPEVGLLSNLQTFMMGNGHMSGSLPASVWNLTKVTDFDIHKNFFTGTIGDNWGSLTQLVDISFEDNGFSGSVPDLPANLSDLQRVYFGSNNLTGKIPASYGSLRSLEQLDLSNNRLQGIIPLEILNASHLSALDLSRNNLEGTIPSNIGVLSMLKYLYLGSNKLYGRVPDSLKYCLGLLILDLSHNQFGGPIPAGIFTAIGSLTALNISGNQFTGAWPSQMSSLANLQQLNISRNSLSGPFLIGGSTLGAAAAAAASNISTTFSGGDGLEWSSIVLLDISYNNFTGDLPETLGLLTTLESFNASYNNFVGPIPTSATGMSVFNVSSFLGNPGLCGENLGPERKCRQALSEKSCHAFGCKYVWMSTLCGLVLLVTGIALLLIIFFCTKLKANQRDRSETTGAQVDNLKFFLDKNISPRDVFRVIHEGANLIGKGSHSMVYKGLFMESQTFAVKVISQNVLQSGVIVVKEEQEGKSYRTRNEDLVKEWELMGKLRHRNILKVIGYCSSMDTQAIILEYMPRGSLHEHLHMSGDCNNCQLSWQMRLSIALGIGEGVKYLHHDFADPLIHGDLKPSNVLLDLSWTPKVADFGVSKLVNPHRDGQATASCIRGTIGYIPPEYALQTAISTAGDVYSFGILLLEMLTATSPASDSSFNSDPNTDFRSWILMSFNHDYLSLLDHTLCSESVRDHNIQEQLRLTFLVALLCTRELPQSRPTMRDALEMLTQISELSSAPTQKKSLDELVSAELLTNTNLWSQEHPNATTTPTVSMSSVSHQ